MDQKSRRLEHAAADHEIASEKVASKVKAASYRPAQPTGLTASLQCQPKAANGVPIVVEACLRYLKASGTDCKGVFRNPGNQRRVDQMWEHMKNHPYARLSANSISQFMSQKEEFSAYEVSSFLKRFVNSMEDTEPVITYMCYGPLVELVHTKCADHLIGIKYKAIIRQLLIAPHRILLARLCNFLLDFSQYEHKTDMDCTALAICFGFLIRSPPEPATSRKHKMRKKDRVKLVLAEAAKAKANAVVIENLITHANRIF